MEPGDCDTVMSGSNKYRSLQGREAWGCLKPVKAVLQFGNTFLQAGP